MEVDPPKEENDKKDSNGDAPAGTDEPPKGEDTEMKDAEGTKEEAPKKEFKTEKRKKVISKTIDLPVTSIVVGALSRDKLEAATEQEKTLTNQDAYESTRLVAKNRYVHLLVVYLLYFPKIPKNTPVNFWT